VAAAAGIDDFARCVVFHSLSKRSNVPGLRAGFVAGDGQFLRDYLTFRTYQGTAPSLLAQNALIAALSDETHVTANRAEYRRKFDAVIRILAPAWTVTPPAGGFYLWLPVAGHDEHFAAGLYREHNVLALPGRYLSRPTDAGDPGAGFIRLALVGSLTECETAAQRLRTYMTSLA
jgi:N-succinyldiaminopimelate aminotransferase